MSKAMKLGLATALVFWLVWLGSRGQLKTFIELATTRKPLQGSNSVMESQ